MTLGPRRGGRLGADGAPQRGERLGGRAPSGPRRLRAGTRARGQRCSAASGGRRGERGDGASERSARRSLGARRRGGAAGRLQAAASAKGVTLHNEHAPAGAELRPAGAHSRSNSRSSTPSSSSSSSSSSGSSSSSSSSSSSLVVVQLGARLVGELEALDELVALVFVERRLLGDQHPLGGVELVHLEDLVVDLGRVVDDDHDLGLGVEVRARAEDQLVELEAARVASSRVYTPSGGPREAVSRIELLQRAGHLGLHVERLEALAQRAVRCAPATSWRTSATSAGRARAARSASREQPRDLGVDVERAARRARTSRSLRARSIWRISCSCSARAAGVRRGRRCARPT